MLPVPMGDLNTEVRLYLFQLPSTQRQYPAVETELPRPDIELPRKPRRTRRRHYPLHSTPKKQRRPRLQVKDLPCDLCRQLSPVIEPSRPAKARQPHRHARRHSGDKSANTQPRVKKNQTGAPRSTIVECRRGVIAVVGCATRKTRLCPDGEMVNVSPPWTDSGVEEVELHAVEDNADTPECPQNASQRQTANITALLAISGTDQCDSPTSMTRSMCGLHGNHLKEVISKVVGTILGTDFLCSCVSLTTSVSSGGSDRSCDNVLELEIGPATGEQCPQGRVTGDGMDNRDTSSLQAMNVVNYDSGVTTSGGDSVTSSSTPKTTCDVTAVKVVSRTDNVTNADDIFASLPVTKADDINPPGVKTCTITKNGTRRTKRQTACSSKEKADIGNTIILTQPAMHMRKSIASSDIRRLAHHNHEEVIVKRNARVECTIVDRNSRMTKLRKRTLAKQLQESVNMRSQFTTLVQF